MTLKITRIFEPAALASLDSQGEVLMQEFVVKAPQDRVWAVIMDNDLLRRRLGLGTVSFTYHEAEEAGSVLEGEYKVPFGTAHFFEKPYEWVNRSYTVGARLFDRGPIRYASLGVELSAVDAEHTRVKAVMKVVLRGILKRLISMKLQKAVAQFPALLLELLEHVRSDQPLSFEASMEPSAAPSLLKKYQSILSRLAPFNAQIEALADYRARASERFLQRLRPYEIADYYRLPRQDTLAFFLEGTQLGIFSLNWDILCPGCRGAKKQSKSLRELEKKVHCEACGINFDVIDSKDVELSFQFAGSLAVEPAPVYCVGNPGRSPSIHAQIPFAPRETRSISIHLPGDVYRLRDMKDGHLVRILVDTNGVTALSRQDLERLKKQGEIKLNRSFTLHWDNASDLWQVLRFDCLDPHHDAATADQVASLPAYKHLFGDDALRPGMQLGVGHLVFLFSDIRGSTQLYRELGDSKAFRLVQDHFALMDTCIRKAGGTIVKTIGDAVMASFNDEEAAIMAAMSVQQHYEAQKGELKMQGLKIALHSGPCIMVNLNDHMDYFGTNVNTCSRLLDQAQDEDIIVSASLFQMPRVQEFLSRQNITWSEDQQVLRGFQDARSFYRLKLMRQMPRSRVPS